MITINDLIIDLENPELRDITTSPSFYFQEGQDQLKKWLEGDFGEEIKAKLLPTSKTYFILKEAAHEEGKLSDISKLLFEIISYCDRSAYSKEDYNRYPDNRVIARSFIRMSAWIPNFIKLKYYPSILKINGAQNAFNYLLDPINNINILSEDHRKVIANKLLKKEYQRKTFTQDLKSIFSNVLSDVHNQCNVTHLITRILYINRELWDEDFVDIDSVRLKEDWEAIERKPIKETTKKALILARIGQGDFRKNLIKIWKGCSVTQYKNTSMLVASHIRPWRKSNDIQRLNPYNGLLLLPNYDKAFDRGYISFSDDGTILISNQLQNHEELGIHSDLKIKLVKESKEFMNYHRNHVFIK